MRTTTLASTILTAAIPAFAYGSDFTNKGTSLSDIYTIPEGTEISGNLNQDGGTLKTDWVTVDGTLYVNGGVVAIGSSGNVDTHGTKAQSLSGSGDINLNTVRPTTTPSPDSNNPYSGELVITDGKNQTYSGKITGNGDLTLVSGTQSFTGTNAITGTIAIRNGTLIVTGNGSINSPGKSATIDVGLSYPDNGHLIVDGPNASIANQVISIGNGDRSYGATGTQGTSDATFKNGAVLDDSKRGHVIVGNWGNAILNVESGSKVNPFALYIGADPTSKGVVNLTDQGSLITARGTYIGATGSGTLNITNNAVYQSTGNVVFGFTGGAGTSSGTINLTNNGVLQAGDANSLPGIIAYKGTTTAFNIDNGIVENIEGKNLTSRISANITDNAFFNAQTNNITWEAGLTGTGNLVKQGNGTLYLASENSYTGGTYVEDGTLALTGSGSLDKSSGVSEKSSTLDLTQASNTSIKTLTGDKDSKVSLGDEGITITNGNSSFGNVFNGTISGQGSVNLTGGSEVFTGNNDYTGTTNVSNSTLEIDGDQTSAKGDTNVTDSGTLQGTGIIGGSVNVTNGTIIAGLPNLTKTLSVNGDLHLGGESTTVVYGNSNAVGNGVVNGEQRSLLQSGMINVNGTAFLGGTLSLVSPSLTYGEAYRVLKANTVSGKYDGLVTSQSYAFVTPLISYDADDGLDYVDITLEKKDNAFSGNTHNEKEVAKALNNLPSNNPIIAGIANTQKGQEKQVLNSLSGEIHSSVRTGLIEDSHLIENAVMNRMVNMDCDSGNGQSTYDLNTHKKHACDADHTILWGQAYGSLGHNSGDGNAAGMSHNTAGFIIGADTLVRGTKWRIGGFAAYGHSMFDVGGRQSSARSDNVTLGGYAATNWGAWHLRTGASYTWNVINTRRTVMGGLGRSTSGYLGGTAQAFAELGYKRHFGKHVFEPFANVTYVNMNTDGFKERGVAGLRGNARNTSTVFTSAGIRYSTQFNVGKMVFQPHVMAAYRHAVGGLYGKSNMRFASGGEDMGITGVALSSNSAIVGAGMSAKLTNRVAVDLSYYGQFGNRSMDNGVTGSFKAKF